MRILVRMGIKLSVWGLITCACLVKSTPVYAERLVAALSSRMVEITSTYTGAELAVYGVVEKDSQTSGRGTDYMIVISVLGPTRHFTVREKGRVGPAWINRGQQTFRNRPSYVGVLSSHPLDQIANENLSRRFDLNLGLELSISRFEERLHMPDKLKRYLDALIRLEKESGRFYQKENGVRFLKFVDDLGIETTTASSLFDAKINLPATVMTGTYTVEIALFADGALLDRKRTFFDVQKSGFEASILDYVRNHAFLYGFALCIIALFFGWLASVIFRRD